MTHRSTWLVCAAVWVACAHAAAGATRYDPSLRFRTLATRHFLIHYHQGEEALAARLAPIVEEVHGVLTARAGHAPRGRTHVVLVDQADRPNGWATPVPYNLIEITAALPTGESLIGNTDDWLRLVFTHEYAHVLHLDRSRGWAAGARMAFGRAPFAFPNLTLPLFHLEGLATWEEGNFGGGRLRAGDFRAIVERAAAAGDFEPLDRVSGGLLDWPSGHGWYAYGALFHEYLANRFGADRFRELANRTAGGLPWLNTRAFRGVFGRSLGDLWREFEAHERGRAAMGQDAAPAPERLTREGYIVSGPRADADGGIVFTHADPHGFPRILRLAPGAATTETLAERTGGEHLAVTRDVIVFDQPELARNVATPSDLYVLDRASGAVQRLTREARLVEPDVSPDGRWLAAIAIRPGRRSLVVLDFAELRGAREPMPASAIDAAIVLGPADVAYATPRWSPEGRRLALEKRGRGERSSIVIWDVHERVEHPLFAAIGGRAITPAWAPDGQAIVFATAEGDAPFDLYRAWLDESGRRLRHRERLTRVAGGARTPDVADSRAVVFVGYTIDGYDVFRVPLPATPGASESGLAGSVPGPVGETHPPPIDQGEYSPLPTLWPRAWTPVVHWDDDEVRAGGFVSGQDALGRHAWSARASWSIARAAELEPVAPGSRPDLAFSYVYDRFVPTLYASYSDETTPLFVPRRDGTRRPVGVRERGFDAGVYVPVRRVKRSQAWLAAWHVDRTDVFGPEDAGDLRRSAARLGWSFNSAQRFGYSISPERGIAAGVSIELTRRAVGADADATFARGDVRAYVPFGPPHAVLALRASGIASRGDERVARVPRLGGHTGDVAVLSFDEDATSLLRGFPGNTFFGRNVVLANAEYRVPLGWIERGLGTWPAFLRGLHAAAFVDAGHAWTDAYRTSDRKLSWGTEIAADAVLGYGLPLTISAGIAWGRDGAKQVPDGRRVYVRVGRAF